MITSRRKHNPNIEEQIETRIQTLHHQINEAQRAVDQKDFHEGSELFQRAKGKLERVEQELDLFDDMPERKLIQTLQIRRDMKMIVNFVRDQERLLVALRQELAQREAQLHERAKERAAHA